MYIFGRRLLAHYNHVLSVYDWKPRKKEEDSLNLQFIYTFYEIKIQSPLGLGSRHSQIIYPISYMQRANLVKNGLVVSEKKLNFFYLLSTVQLSTI